MDFAHERDFDFLRSATIKEGKARVVGARFRQTCRGAGGSTPSIHTKTENGGYEYMKATIEISEETMNTLADALNLPPLYDEDYGVDEDSISYAIKEMVELYAD